MLKQSGAFEFSPLTIDTLLERAQKAQQAIEACAEERLDEAVLSAGWAIYKNAGLLSELAVNETKIGCVEDSCARLRQRTQGVLQDLAEARTSGLVEEDRTRGIRKFAKPVGIIAAITPSTAPASAIVMHALCALKTRNAIIFCANPSAKMTAIDTTEILRGAMRKAGMPADVFQSIAEPARESANELMAKADLVLASGGEGTVRRAYSSGTPAYGAGTGNSSVIVDETADIDSAATQIVAGASYDNGSSCSAESNIVVAARVYESLKNALRAKGGHICDDESASRLRDLVWTKDGSISRAVVGQSANRIAHLAGIQVSENTKVLFIEGGPGLDRRDPLRGEKLCPVVGLWKYEDDIEDAIATVEQLTNYRGRGHSCGIYSESSAHVDRLAARAKLTRVMVNQSTCFGNSGSFGNGLPFSVIVSCGTWGGSSLSENVTWRQFLNYTYVSYKTADRSESLEKIFHKHWRKYGR